MPIYEYLCKDCGQRFEMLRMIKDADTPIPCISCRGVRTQRAVSVFFAQSGSKVIAGGSNGGCAGCSGGSCSSCNPN
jgi:putative FmdB family regulatory protein